MAEVEGVSGEYFVHRKAARSSTLSHDEAIAGRLWQVSAGLTRWERWGKLRIRVNADRAKVCGYFVFRGRGWDILGNRGILIRKS